MALELVDCRVCHKLFKSLAAHLKLVHNLSIVEYREQNGADAPIGYSIRDSINAGKSKNSPPDAIKIRKKSLDPVGSMMDNLSDSETKFYTSRYSTLFKQADYDEALVPPVRQIIMNEIIAMRHQAEINQITSDNKPDLDRVNSLSKYVKDITETNLKLMDKMNLTREKKQAAKKSPETTPSRMVTAFRNYRDRMSPEERQRDDEDMEDAVKRYHSNQADLLSIVPQSAGSEADEELEIAVGEPV